MERTNTWNKGRAAQLGAGLSFALGSALFAITGEWAYLLLVPAGALVGLAVGALAHRYPPLREGGRRTLDAAKQGGSILLERFADERLLVRFGLLFLLSLALFLATWSLAYAFLPERLLAAGNPARLAGHEEVSATLWSEWQSLVARNLPWVAGIALINLLVGYPYACLVPLWWTVFYALLLGTNSFAIPMPEPMAPSLEVLGRAGPYELVAFLFAAAATYPLSRISLPWRKVHVKTPVRRWEVALGLLLGAAGILLAAWREAAMLLAR
jgi:hypothetical protein